MQLHNNSGNITVIIDVSFDDRDMFTDFILNEQCLFIDSVDPEGLIKFEWFLDKDSNTGTLVCLLYTSPSPRDVEESRMPSSA